MNEETLFEHALNLPEAERAAMLDRECRGDAKLRARVEALLAAHFAVAGNTAAHGAPEATADFPGKDEHLGAILGGKYKLIEEIGEGGMGSVYMAQQTEPVKRAVAVKVIKAGMDSKAVLARFEAERQALAMMDHPNIAKVLDAGTTESGRPFFVMELVKGTPITNYCDERKLTPRQRLELFVPVCNAIQHAHQKGIIHRDIKPSNVLVAMYDDTAVPKVIDFGVAKAAGQSLTDKTLMTGFGAVVGTPEYMSPEQANLNNLDIDTRSDVYSLGVLLYELLTGTTPVDRKSLGKAALLEILRIVREVEAPRPSAKLSTIDTLPSVAANRSTEPAKLSKLMKGELDWVLLKALEKDRTRRYESANGLAKDVQRYLAGDAVEACPPTWRYRLKKAYAKNRSAVRVAAAFLFLALVAAGMGIGLAVRAEDNARQARDAEARVTQQLAATEAARKAENEQRARADEEAAIATAVSDFLQKDLLDLADSDAQLERGEKFLPDPDVRVRVLLDRAAESVGEKFKGQPRVEAAIRQTIGNAYRGVGEYAKSAQQYERASELLAPMDAIQGMLGLAETRYIQGDMAQGRELARKSWEMARARHGDDHAVTLKALDMMYRGFANSNRSEGRAFLRQVIAELTAAHGAEHDSTLTVLGLLTDLGPDDRLEICQRVYEARIRMHGPDSPETIKAEERLVRAHWAMVNKGEKPEGPISWLYRKYEELRDTPGPFEKRTLYTLFFLTRSLGQANRRDEAIELLRSNLDGLKRSKGDRHPKVRTIANNLAYFLLDAKRTSEAVQACTEEFELTCKHYGPEHPYSLLQASALGDFLLSDGKTDDAIRRYESVLEVLSRKPTPNPNVEQQARLGLAKAHSKAGRHEESLENCKKALKLMSGMQVAPVDTLYFCESLLVYQYWKLNRTAEVIPRLDALLKRLTAEPMPRSLAAVTMTEDLLQIRAEHFGKRNDGPESRATAEMYENNARATASAFYNSACYRARASQGYASKGQLAEAKADAEKAVKHLASAVGNGFRDHKHMAADPDLKCLHDHDMFLAIVAYLDRETAIPLLEAKWRRLEARLGADHADTLSSRLDYAVFIRDSGKPEALQEFTEIVKLAKAKQGPESPFVGTTLAYHGLALLYVKSFAEAESVIRECLAVREKTMPDDWRTFNTRAMLGLALLGQKNHAAAEPLLLSGFAEMKKREKSIPPQAMERFNETIDGLIALYTATNKPDEAAKWRAERAKYPNIAPLPRVKP